MSIGGWAKIDCSCANRRPLSTTARYDIPYECGHNDGILFASSWYELSHIGFCLDQVLSAQPEKYFQLRPSASDQIEVVHRQGSEHRCSPAIPNYVETTYRIFLKATRDASYEDEQLQLSVGEVEEWLLEIRQLQEDLEGRGSLDMPAVRALWRGLLGTKFLMNEGGLWQKILWTESEIFEGLALGERLCNASMGTGNPINLSI